MSVIVDVDIIKDFFFDIFYVLEKDVVEVLYIKGC